MGLGQRLADTFDSVSMPLSDGSLVQRRPLLAQQVYESNLAILWLFTLMG
jgi:hypothetical protein